MSRTTHVVVAALALACFVGFAQAQVTAPPEVDARLDRLEREIARLEREMERLADEEQSVLGRLDRLAARARLLDARREALALEREAVARERERLELEEQAEEQALSRARERLARTAVLLHRVGPLARVRPLLDNHDGSRLGASLRLAHELTERQHEEVEDVQRRMARLESLREEKQARDEELEQLSADLSRARSDLRATIASRRRLLEDVRGEQHVREEALEELHRARQALGDVIAGRTGMDSARLDIRRFQGLLDWPVQARVSVPFGDRRDPRFGTTLPHPGWDLDASFGASVRSIFEGTVVYADWLRGYGLVVVIDHGHRVHSVFAHLSAILVEQGTTVDQGRVIGRVGDTGSLQGPLLYMEIRVDGKAVDPATWLRDRDGT